MEHSEQKLKIGLIEPNENVAKKIKKLFDEQKNETTGNVTVFDEKNKDELERAIKKEEIDTLVINIFDYGIQDAIKIIDENRENMPICILGTEEQLAGFEGVPLNKAVEFAYYCKMATNSLLEDMEEDVRRVSKFLLQCRMEKIAKKQLDELVEICFVLDDDNSNEEKIEKIEKIKSTISLVGEQNKELNARNKERRSLKDEFNDEILKTLKETSKTMKKYETVNMIIVGSGLGLIALAFITFLITNNPTILSFGGAGFLAVITSLIKDPANSISKAAKQLILIQISYLGFWKQVQINESVESKEIDDMIRHSKCI